MSENEPVEIWGEYDMEIDREYVPGEENFLKRTLMPLEEYLEYETNIEKQNVKIIVDYDNISNMIRNKNIQELELEPLYFYVDDIINNHELILRYYKNSFSARAVILINKENKNKKDIADIKSVTNISTIRTICNAQRFKKDKNPFFNSLESIVEKQENNGRLIEEFNEVITNKELKLKNKRLAFESSCFEHIIKQDTFELGKKEVVGPSLQGYN